MTHTHTHGPQKHNGSFLSIRGFTWIRHTPFKSCLQSIAYLHHLMGWLVSSVTSSEWFGEVKATNYKSMQSDWVNVSAFSNLLRITYVTCSLAIIVFCVFFLKFL